MATNPYLYPKRYSSAIAKANPSMTRELYMEGYGEACTLVNCIIGVANEVARLAISDGIEAIRKEGLYAQKTKQLCRETFRRQEHYENLHNQNFGDRLTMWLDYLDLTEDEYRKHIFKIYMAVKMILDKHKESKSALKARLECGLICAELAVGQFDALMRDLKKRYGADYSSLFAEARYDRPLFTWKKLCGIHLKTDSPDDKIDLNDDANLRMAVDVLARKLSDTDSLNRMGIRAIGQNVEVARKYATEEELLELGIDEGQHSGKEG